VGVHRGRTAREELLCAVRDRLEQIDALGDFSLALAPGTRAEMRQLAKLLRCGEGDLETLNVLGWLHYFRYRALPRRRGRRERAAAVQVLVPCFLAGGDDLPEPLLPLIVAAAEPFAQELLDYIAISYEADFDHVVDLWQRMRRAAPADHPDQAWYKSSLGVALQLRFKNTGMTADLDEAVEVGQEAVTDTPTDHPGWAARMSNLGLAFLTRFEAAGVTADADEAVARLQQALDAIPADHLARAGCFSNLGNALCKRYAYTGLMTDVDRAIEVGLQAVAAATAPGHPDRTMSLANLGNALQARFERTGAVKDLDNAVDCYQAAVRATPADHHPDRARTLVNLGSALQRRFERTESLEDLDDAVGCYQAATQAIPASHPDRVNTLSNLGIAVQARFEHTGVAADADRAVTLGREAVAATPTDHPDRACLLSNLGNALRARFEHSGAPADADAALSCFLEAWESDTARPSLRVSAAWTAAQCLMDRSDPERAVDVIEAAVRLLPEVAPRRLDRTDQQHVLGRLAGLADDAAALALTHPHRSPPERAARALQLMEASRAVLLSQALDTRSDLTDLRQQHPGLAERFVGLRDRLDQPTAIPAPAEGINVALRQEREVRDRRRLTRDFDALLAEIRALDTFASFALPPAADELQAQADQGPIVVLNVSRYRSDALLLTQAGPAHVELPMLTPEAVIGKVSDFYEALDITVSREANMAQRRTAQAKLVRILEWLWEAAAGPVLTALGVRRQPAQGELMPRLWWAQGGLMSLLPLHAAGYHTDPADDPGRRTVMDRVVSSCTPTVRALRYARQHMQHQTPTPSAPPRALVVAMPMTPGLPGNGRLANVVKEATKVQTHLPNPMMLCEPDIANKKGRRKSSRVPTKANVLAHLPTCSIAHFACHGTTDPTDPSQSRLLLRDHVSDPLTVASLAPVILDKAQLAYLSACDTAAIGTPELLNESIHLTAAFQLAGFPHVIGTLWEVNDKICVEVADAFYTQLCADGHTLDPGHAARALHATVRTVRDRLPQTPSLWAAYLHAGA
jgi:tetratricopeptide (TPR) repeat protein